MCPRVSIHWWSSRLRCVPPLRRCPLVRRRSFCRRRLHPRCLLYRSCRLCRRRLLRSREDSFSMMSTNAWTRKKKNDPKLAAYDIDWLDSSATNNECLKYAHIKKLPSTQEGKLSFLLSKFETSDIKTAFADAIGRVGKPAKTVFYPLPLRKEKLVKGFLELISGKNSIMVDHSKDSFRWAIFTGSSRME